MNWMLKPDESGSMVYPGPNWTSPGAFAMRRSSTTTEEPSATYSRLDLPGLSTQDTVRVLLERGTNPDAHYRWGGEYRFTALMGAFGEGEQGPVNAPAHREWEALARLLLDGGADPNDGQGLYNRMFGRDNRCLKLLLEYGLNRRHRLNWGPGAELVLDYQLTWAVRNHYVPGEAVGAARGRRGRAPSWRYDVRGSGDARRPTRSWWEFLVAHGARRP